MFRTSPPSACGLPNEEWERTVPLLPSERGRGGPVHSWSRPPRGGNGIVPGHSKHRTQRRSCGRGPHRPQTGYVPRWKARALSTGLGGGGSSASSGGSAIPGFLNGFSDGGFTGAGGRNDPKGVVHGGEYVFSKAAVQRMGLQNLESMHRGALRGYAGAALLARVFRPLLRQPDVARRLS